MVVEDLLNSIQSAPVKEALKYWDTVRGSRSMPRREDLDLVDIPKLLVNVSIVDVVGGGDDFISRYIGRGISERQSLRTGERFTDLPVEQGRSLILGRYRKVISEKRPVLQTYVFTSSKGDRRKIEVLSCPLSDDGDEVNKIFTYGYDLGFAVLTEDGDTLI